MHRMIFSLVVLLGLSGCAGSGSPPVSEASVAVGADTDDCPQGVVEKVRMTGANPGNIETFAWQTCPSPGLWMLKRSYDNIERIEPSVTGLTVGYQYGGNNKEMGLAFDPVIRGETTSASVPAIKLNHGYSYLGHATLDRSPSFDYTLPDGRIVPAADYKFHRRNSEGAEYDWTVTEAGPILVQSSAGPRLIYFPVESKNNSFGGGLLSYKAIEVTFPASK